MMSTFNQWRRLTILGLYILILIGCSSDDVEEKVEDPVIPSNFVSDIIEKNPDYSILLTALEKTGLKRTLSAWNGEFTFLAPNNEAFDNYLTEKGFENINSIPTEMLTQLVRNHIIFGEFLAADIYTESLMTTANGHSIYFNVSNDIFINGISKVTTTN